MNIKCYAVLTIGVALACVAIVGINAMSIIAATALAVSVLVYKE